MGNDVSLYDEVQQTEVNKEHVDNVKSYLGSAEQALDAARSSAKESEIQKILYHEGDPNRRNSMTFILQYRDGSISPPLVYGLVKCTAEMHKVCHKPKTRRSRATGHVHYYKLFKFTKGSFMQQT